MKTTRTIRRLLRTTGVILALLIVLFLLRVPILRGLGNFLVADDPLVHSDAIVVLGGNSYERGATAVRLWEEGKTDHILCTGGNVPVNFLAIDTMIYEAHVTASMLAKRGVPAQHITALTGSTSTKEESEEVSQWCRDRNIDTLTVISSAMHLRRVRMVFEEAFETSEVNVRFYPAKPKSYTVDAWWKSEEGLIMVNNEYVKYVYYLLKY